MKQKQTNQKPNMYAGWYTEWQIVLLDWEADLKFLLEVEVWIPVEDFHACRIQDHAHRLPVDETVRHKAPWFFVSTDKELTYTKPHRKLMQARSYLFRETVSYSLFRIKPASENQTNNIPNNNKKQTNIKQKEWKFQAKRRMHLAPKMKTFGFIQ